MCNRPFFFCVVGFAAVALVAAVAVAADDQPTNAKQKIGPDGQPLVPLKIKLPRPLFLGTPKHIKASDTLEKYSEKAPPPFFVPKGVANLALEKKVTSSDSLPIIGELSMVTDGDKEGYDGSYVELGPSTQWVQIDLGKPADIYAVLVSHYHAEGRVYHDVVVQVADDADFIKNVSTIYNNDFDNSSGLGLGKQLEYIDDFRGRLLTLLDAKTKKQKPIRGRFVRLYSRGNTSNDMNHYIEVEVHGKPAR